MRRLLVATMTQDVIMPNKKAYDDSPCQIQGVKDIGYCRVIECDDHHIYLNRAFKICLIAVRAAYIFVFCDDGLTFTRMAIFI